MAKKANFARPFLFIDTNILLDFYRARAGTPVTLLNHIEKVSDVLILTDQIEAEFLNNRQNVIMEALESLKAPAAPIFPAFLADSSTSKAIEGKCKQIREQVERLKSRLLRLLENPAKYDPVYKAFKRAMEKDTQLMNLNLKDEDSEMKENIRTLALRRFQRGLPPRKKDGSIGDAINWEWILACARPRRRHLLIVSRDKDFGVPDKKFLNEYLAHEYKSEIGCEALLIPSLAEALKILHVKITAAEENVERSMISFELSPAFNLVVTLPANFWKQLLERVEAFNPETRRLLDRSGCALLDNGVFLIVFPYELNQNVKELDNEETRSLLREAIAYLGYGNKVSKIVFSAESGTRFGPPIFPSSTTASPAT